MTLKLIYRITLATKCWDVLTSVVVAAETIPDAITLIEERQETYYSTRRSHWNVDEVKYLGQARPGIGGRAI